MHSSRDNVLLLHSDMSLFHLKHLFSNNLHLLQLVLYYQSQSVLGVRMTMREEDSNNSTPSHWRTQTRVTYWNAHTLHSLELDFRTRREPHLVTHSTWYCLAQVPGPDASCIAT